MAISIELDDTEQEVFDTEFERFADVHLKQREFIDIFADHREYILETVQVAKNQFESEFGGIHATSNQFGWSMIRPEVIRTTSKAAPVRDWNKDVTATGWDNLFGSSGSEVKVNEEGLVCILGYVNFSPSPKSVALKNIVMGDEKPVYYMEPAMKMSELSVFELPKPFRVLPLKTFYTRALYNSTGRDVLAPFGIYFGTGSHLREEGPYPDNAV